MKQASRIAAHLGNRVSAQSENPRRLAPALPFDEDKPSNRCVNLHREYPRPSLFESDFEKVRPRKWPGFTPPRATALCSVAYYCTAAYSWIGAASGRRKSEEPPLLLPIVQRRHAYDLRVIHGLGVSGALKVTNR